MFKVAVDPGHGGGDPGGQSLGLAEKHLTLSASFALWKALADTNQAAIPTRVRDKAVALGDRAAYANLAGADVFISLHANAAANREVRGAWVIYAAPSAKGKDLAEHIAQALGFPGTAYPDQSPWVGGRRLAVLRQTQMPAVLIEMGFMTNRLDLERLEDEEMQDEMMRKVVKGLGLWVP